MLVSGRMENHFRLKFPENRCHPLPIENSGNQTNHLTVEIKFPKLLLDQEHLNFRLLDQQKSARIALRDLTAQLTSDTSSSSADRYRFPFDQTRNLIGFEFDRLPPKQVLNLHRPQLCQTHPPRRHLVERRNR